MLKATLCPFFIVIVVAAAAFLLRRSAKEIEKLDLMGRFLRAILYAALVGIGAVGIYFTLTGWSSRF